ncbi:oxoglutarate/iron-dependent oxygenase [Astrocystis sublimbata]|nr:oxoglutarate/iron-dependent oxygenase [Astrocystis sublimbata]
MAPETKYTNRPIPRISLHDFEARKDVITASLVSAAEEHGFFAVVDHGIPWSAINAQFLQAERFFALSDEVKATVPFAARNVGWEKQAQVRPSTGQPDQKESYQMQYGPSMDGAWLSEDAIPGFRGASQAFMRQAQGVSEKLMTCLARGLGFDDDHFVRAHDVADPDIQTVLRLLHYLPLDPETPVPETYYRAGAHTDFGLLTLLFQRPGESGLEICPGREVFTEFGRGDTWTKVEPVEGEIICNIGDLLMSWSDDRFKSTFHRVRTPRDPLNDHFGSRYSIAYFNQPIKNCRIQGPLKKYPAVTGAEFMEAAYARFHTAFQSGKAADRALMNAQHASQAASASA